jgi:PAS domain-containing protein
MLEAREIDHLRTENAELRRRLREAEEHRSEHLERLLRDRDTHLHLAMDAALAIAFEWDIVRNRVRRIQSIEVALPETVDAPDTLEGVARVVHPEDRERFFADVRAALTAESREYHSEYRIVRPDGSIRWLSEFGRVERDAGGRPARLIGISVDVTERRKAEEELSRTEATLRSFYESSPLLMGVVELS